MQIDLSPKFTLSLSLSELTFLSNCMHQALVFASQSGVEDVDSGKVVVQLPEALITIHNKLADLIGEFTPDGGVTAV
jgi:hypothetical protein